MDPVLEEFSDILRHMICEHLLGTYSLDYIKEIKEEKRRKKKNWKIIKNLPKQLPFTVNQNIPLPSSKNKQKK